MNSFLECHPTDAESWLELADLYLEHLKYNNIFSDYPNIR